MNHTALAEPVTAEELIDVVAPAPTPPPVTNPAAAPPGQSQPAPAAPPPTPENDPFRGQKDARGVEWNPVKFRLKDGRPQLDKLGRYVPLGIGRGGKPDEPPAPGAETPPTATPPVDSGSRLPFDDTPPVAPPPPDVTAEISVEVAIGIVQTALIMIGEEEGILDELEQRMLRGPLVRVLAKYNLASKMTPELETAAVIATLVMRRLKKPKTQGWFQSKLTWLRNWWLARRVRRVVPDPMPATAHP